LLNGTKATDPGMTGIKNMTAMPCGLAAAAVFNDTYELVRIDPDTKAQIPVKLSD